MSKRYISSQYRHSQLQLQHCPFWRSVLEGLILRTDPTSGQYGKILPSRLRIQDIAYLSSDSVKIKVIKDSKKRLGIISFFTAIYGSYGYLLYRLLILSRSLYLVDNSTDYTDKAIHCHSLSFMPDADHKVHTTKTRSGDSIVLDSVVNPPMGP